MKQLYSTSLPSLSSILVKPSSLLLIVLFITTHSFSQSAAAKNGFLNESNVNGDTSSLKGKTYIYPTAVQSFLPGTLVNWTANVDKNKVLLNWTTTVETNTLHFTVEKSFDGIEYTDAAIIFAAGNSNIRKQYVFSEKLSLHPNKNLYYRLKMVDIDANSKYSDVRIVRSTKQEAVLLELYPNPAVNDLKLTVNSSWVNQKLLIEVCNINGVVVKSKVNEKASETETVNVKDLVRGMYIVKVSNGKESSLQQFLKN